ncbi:MAG: energy transducer TonB [Erythrobacter sp.]
MKAVFPISLLAAIAFPQLAFAQDETQAEVEALVETIKQVKEEAPNAPPSPRRMPPSPPPIRIPPPAPPVGAASEIAVESATDYDPAPRPRLTNWREARPTAADYPPASWVADEEGIVEYDLSVDTEGKVSGCTVITSSGHKRLDDLSCAISTERAIFEPATDRDGQPVASVFGITYSWRKREQEFPGTTRVKVRFTINEQGLTEDCEVLEFSGDMSEMMRKSFEKDPCPGPKGRPRAPYCDENGVPVAKRVTMDFAVEITDPE